MKLVSYNYLNMTKLGVLSGTSEIIDVFEVSNGSLPNNMRDFLNAFHQNLLMLKEHLNNNKYNAVNLNSVDIYSPIVNPTSFRDAYAFRKHVEAGRRNRGLEMIPEYDEFPVFYFSNHNSITGPGNVFIQNRHLEKMDFEFEIAIIIGKKGKNIEAKDSLDYIAGLTIMNDWSARGLQFKEMKLNLGPAKGKDFATSIGPYLVTLDDLNHKIIKKGKGFSFDLQMKGFVNDKLISTDNMKNMFWTFSDIIERASYGVELVPGDVIGSGTCATGCFLELNQTNKSNNWINNGDTVRLEVEELGSLVNKIVLQ